MCSFGIKSVLLVRSGRVSCGQIDSLLGDEGLITGNRQHLHTLTASEANEGQ